jgi:type IV secretory pathway VirB4 component
VTRLGPSIYTAGPVRRRITPPTPALIPSPTSTWQARVLNSGIAGSSGSEHGIAVGLDESSQTAVYHDVFTRYEEKRLSNPNVIIVGPVGAGKSVLTKATYIMRQLMLYDRAAVVLDLKARGDDGDSEYGELTRYLGGDPYLMWPGHPDCTRINPLTRVILRAGGAPASASLLNAIAELGGDGPLDPIEQDALGTAHQTLLGRFEDLRTPTLPDLVELMPEVVDLDRYKRYREATKDRVDEAALLVQTRLRRALADDVAGLFDGDTSENVTNQVHKLTTYNIANLPKRGPAMGMVMAVVHAQLMSELRNNPKRRRTTLVMEEAWAYEAVAREIRSNEKLARGLGLSNVGILQHLSDARPGTDGEALVREAGTAHIFRQEQQTDVDDCIAAFNLNPANAELLRTLPQGHHLLRVGTNREVHVRGELTDTEYRITETDEAMKGNR